MEPVEGRPAAASRGRRGSGARVFVGVALVLAAVVLLVLRARTDSVVYYVTVTELLARSAQAENRGLRVTGKVVPGTIAREGRRLTFHVTDGAQAVPVSYEGIVPETFTDESEVVVEGSYLHGRFEANGLLTKCPSKYATEEHQTGAHPGAVPKPDAQTKPGRGSESQPDRGPESQPGSEPEAEPRSGS